MSRPSLEKGLHQLIVKLHTLYTYLSHCTQSADTKAFQGTACTTKYIFRFAKDSSSLLGPIESTKIPTERLGGILAWFCPNIFHNAGMAISETVELLLLLFISSVAFFTYFACVSQSNPFFLTLRWLLQT